MGTKLQKMSDLYWHISLYLSIAYVIVIFGIKFFMSFRDKGYDLRKYLSAWNILLSIFSICGVIRCLPEFLHIIYTKGMTASFCDASYYEDARLNIWYLFFTLSKALELFDTVFIVLRKQKLIHLHWVHHVLTLTYSWYVFADVPSTARWMVNMNFLIHSMMYTYYALRAMRFVIPRVVNVTITSLQIAQMFAGLFINYLALHYKLSGTPCDLSRKVAVFGFSLYFLFFLLFMNFFIRSYILKASPQQQKGKHLVSNGYYNKPDINQNTNFKNNYNSNGYTANGIGNGVCNGKLKKTL
ncbi:elongation of very long chain fatty acids protein 6-like [Oppia nitens]|uniref:elongation of very long chain fatty acids protein 6-like n=1 Tax=Oppia nitens TaxID=1686743 RepID=UPI0023DA506C|nr:elongation of very long chain fatty acids protein 6-like [Oppia nitens]